MATPDQNQKDDRIKDSHAKRWWKRERSFAKCSQMQRPETAFGEGSISQGTQQRPNLLRPATDFLAISPHEQGSELNQWLTCYAAKRR
jgi:hypothetical protein